MRMSSAPDLNTLLKDMKSNAQAVIILAVLLFVMDAFFILRWQFSSLGRLFNESRQLSREIKTTDVDAKLSPTFVTKVEDLKNEIAALDKTVVREGGLPSVIESVSKFANVSGVKILAIRPLGASGPTAAQAGGVVESGGLVREKVSITGRCGFHQLGRFLAFLESAQVFMDITNLEIRADDQDFMRQSVTIVLEVVVQRD